MGKGDKKSRRGKIINKSFGVRRRRDSGTAGILKEAAPVAAKAETPAPSKPVKPRTPRKKAE